jgi:glycosyltransferase involved in cell wall biosynthesis
MSRSLISCIVPVFNGARYLREALESIFQQTYRPLEVIIADDGSTDGTVAVAQSYGDGITYLKQANAGPAAARNLGLSRARGEFVAFLDADDLWHVEKLDRQMARFQARSELDLCITHVREAHSQRLVKAPAKEIESGEMIEATMPSTASASAGTQSLT